jgi:hypothetical protein
MSQQVLSVESFKDLLQSLVDYQRRASQFLTSFLFGGVSYNIDGFNMSTMNSDAFMASLKIIILFMTLPLTKNEWPWVDPKNETNSSPENGGSQKGSEEHESTKMGNALTYLMNAVFVLMTTNYTLNPSFYFLGSQSSKSES